MTEKKTVIVAAAVIVADGRVLLTQRPAGTHLSGTWEFPGGKLEPEEHPEDALVREIREEIGVGIVVDGIFDVAFWPYPTRNVLLLFYRARIVSGEVADLGVAAHAWVTAEGLQGYEFPPADVRVVEKVRIALRTPD